VKPDPTIVFKRPPSRRATLTGLAALLAAGSARAETPVPPAELSTRNDPGQRLTIEVRINGAGPYRFVVDTGAERSVIADTVAAELKLPTVGRVLVDGIVRKIPADLAAVDSLSFGPFSRNAMHIPVLPRQFLLVDGYLGLDAIDGNRVTFDFEHHLLKIDPSHSAPPPSVGDDVTVTVVARGAGGRLRAGHCWIDGVSAAAFIDSGAEVSMGNTALKNALAARRAGVQELGPIVLTGVTGGETVGEVIAIRRIHLQDMAVENDLLAISDTASFDAWGLTDSPALLLGMNFLRQFAKVSIDYRRAEIRFELSEAAPLTIARA
jgi:predicted aspartyl protease